MKHKKLWISYLIIYCIVVLIITPSYFLIGHSVRHAAIFAIDLFPILGLYCFVRKPSVSYPFFWTILAVIFTARILVFFNWGAGLLNLLPWASHREQYHLLGVLLAILFQTPMLYALWRYSFRKRSI